MRATRESIELGSAAAPPSWRMIPSRVEIRLFSSSAPAAPRWASTDAAAREPPLLADAAGPAGAFAGGGPALSAVVVSGAGRIAASGSPAIPGRALAAAASTMRAGPAWGAPAGSGACTAGVDWPTVCAPPSRHVPASPGVRRRAMDTRTRTMTRMPAASRSQRARLPRRAGAASAAAGLRFSMSARIRLDGRDEAAPPALPATRLGRFGPSIFKCNPALDRRAPEEVLSRILAGGRGASTPAPRAAGGRR